MWDVGLGFYNCTGRSDKVICLRKSALLVSFCWDSAVFALTFFFFWGGGFFFSFLTVNCHQKTLKDSGHGSVYSVRSERMSLSLCFLRMRACLSCDSVIFGIMVLGPRWAGLIPNQTHTDLLPHHTHTRTQSPAGQAASAESYTETALQSFCHCRRNIHTILRLSPWSS